ncbi:MAG: hypothetical protein AB8F74_19525 [Saprospiraceae bacterium]
MSDSDVEADANEVLSLEAQKAFYADGKLKRLAKKLKIQLETTSRRGTVALNKSNKSARSTKETYSGKLKQFIEFLKMVGRDHERFILLRTPPKECPSVCVDSLVDFIEYKLEINKNKVIKTRNKEALKDVNGNDVLGVGGWGKNGSTKSISGLESAVTAVFRLQNRNHEYQYPEKEGVKVTKDRKTWASGNPIDDVEFQDYVAKVKRGLNETFVSQARSALTPSQQKNVLQCMCAFAVNGLTWVMVNVIWRVCCELGARIEEVTSLTYGQLLSKLTREEPNSDNLMCIGVRIIGKCENLASDYQADKKAERKAHIQLLYRNRVDEFSSALESVLCWVSIMKSSGVDTSPDSHLFPKFSILQLMEEGKFTPGKIIREPKCDDSDKTKKRKRIDMVVPPDSVNGKLKEVFKKTLPDFDDPERHYSSHSGRKIKVLNSLLTGQYSRTDNGTYAWKDTDVSALGKTIRMVDQTLNQFYKADADTYVEMLRGDSDEFRMHLDVFRPGFVASDSSSLTHHGKVTYYFGESPPDDDSSALSIYEYWEKKVGPMKNAMDYYKYLKSTQDWPSKIALATKEFGDFQQFISGINSYSTEIGFTDDVVAKMSRLITLMSTCRGKKAHYNPYSKKASTSTALTTLPTVLNRKRSRASENSVSIYGSRDRALRTIEERDRIVAQKKSRTAEDMLNELKQINESEHANALGEFLTKEQIKEIRTDLKALTKNEGSADEFIKKLLLLRDNDPQMNQWYYTQKGKPMKGARSDRSKSDFCKRTLKPILLCYEGVCKCFNGTCKHNNCTYQKEPASMENTSKRVDDNEEQDASLLDQFLTRNHVQGPISVVDKDKKLIFLTGWDKGCRCLVSS